MENPVCTYCQNAISTCRIVCVECKDIELCLQCFACGIETASHKKDHDYRVAEDTKFTLFPGADAWSAEEEESFLESVEQYGFGNWEDVAKLMGSKTEEECREHYNKYYIHGNIGKVTFPSEKPNKFVDHSCPAGGPLSPAITLKLPPVELTLAEQSKLGYMPLRDDYENENDNEAELLVSSLTVEYDDEEIDKALKLAHVDMFRRRLRERQRCKRLAREYSIVKSASVSLGLASSTSTPKKSHSSSNSSKKHRKQSKDERDLNERLKPYARFHSAAEHDKILEDFMREKRLKTRIKELTKYRKNGITKLEDSRKYETQRLHRGSSGSNGEKKGESTLKKLGGSPHPPPPHPLKAMMKPQTQTTYPILSQTAMALKQMPANSSFPMEEAQSKENVDENAAIITAGDARSSGGNGLNPKELATVMNNGLLTSSEKKFCRNMTMKPAMYITIKTCIIKDYLQRGKGIPVKIRYPSHLDKTHRRRILSFLSDNGWISSIVTNSNSAGGGGSS